VMCVAGAEGEGGGPAQGPRQQRDSRLIQRTEQQGTSIPWTK
jgi:hypothetical protein